MVQWRLRISHHFSGEDYWEVLLRIFSGTVTTKEILEGPRRRRKEQEKARNVWSFKGDAKARI